MNYQKILLPDWFDPETDKILIHREVPDWDKQSDTIEVLKSGIAEIWKPQYREVLDHGFIGLVDFMGDDDAIVQAARVSYGAGTKKKNTDEGLIRYLVRHRHTTPLEMCEFKFHVKAPIFVFRQWHRHRMANINEYSARYSVLSDDAYVPRPEHIAMQSKTNKQGRSGEVNENNAKAVQIAIESAYEEAFRAYKYLLGQAKPQTVLEVSRVSCEAAAMQAIRTRRNANPEWSPTEDEIDQMVRQYFLQSDLFFTDREFVDHEGVARELARVIVPVGTYSQMYWKCDLHNLLHFIGLRSDPHAQYEIRVYSDAMLDMIQPIVPIAVKAYMDYRMNGATFSRMELDALKAMVEKSGMTAEAVTKILRSSGASQREVTEFITRLCITP